MARTDTLPHFLTDVADAIRTKAGTSETIQASSFDTAIANLPSGSTEIPPSDVNFYDYDGTITNAYTKAQFLALSAMPDNPTHEGLTSQGWNWTFSDAQTYVTNNGYLEIGQMYVTNDNSTRLYVTIETLNRTPYVGIAINGTATVNWGDGNTSTLTGTSISTVTTVSHTYANTGDYVISISSESDYHLIGDANYYNPLYFAGITSGNYVANSAYTLRLYKIELSSNVVLDNYALKDLKHLKSITMPNTMTTLGQYIVQNTESLKHLTIPSSCTSISSYCLYSSYFETISLPKNLTFNKNYAIATNTYIKRITLPLSTYKYNMSGLTSLSKLIIPIGVTILYSNFCGSLPSLTEVKIPNTVTEFGNTTFGNCYNLRIVDFTTFNSVPLGGNFMFSGCHEDLQIIVPDALYETWKSANYWSSYANNIVKASEA